MKKTRFPGLYRLPDGRFRVRVTVKDQRTGKMKDKVRTLEAGLSEEEAAMEALAFKQMLRGERVRPSPSTLSGTDYGVQWLEGKARRLRPSVANRYEAALSRFILPRIGHIRLDQIHREDVERWVAWAERATMDDGRPYAKATVLGWWRILRCMLRDAVADYDLPHDPTYRVMAPKPEAITRRELRTLSLVELEALLAALKKHCPERYTEVFVLAFTGMRAGEGYALLWADVDEAKGCIHVRYSVWKGQVSGTKTDDPRDVALTEELMEVLREQRTRLIKEQHPGLEKGLVFPADNGGYRMPQSLHKPLAIAANAAGIEIRVTAQVLRRTFNTLMQEVGVNPVVLRSQMGHSSPEMTNRYSGVSIEAKCKAVKGLIAKTKEARRA